MTITATARKTLRLLKITFTDRRSQDRTVAAWYVTKTLEGEGLGGRDYQISNDVCSKNATQYLCTSCVYDEYWRFCIDDLKYYLNAITLRVVFIVRHFLRIRLTICLFYTRTIKPKKVTQKAFWWDNIDATLRVPDQFHRLGYFCLMKCYFCHLYIQSFSWYLLYRLKHHR